MIERVLQAAVDAARAAGEIQRRGREAGVRVEVKGEADITTEVDLACERAITELVAKRFPDHGVLGEEGTARATDARWLWIIDPLDGTKNYTHGHPRCGVSIAVAREGVTVAAAVYAPFTDELLTAALGVGARCNGRDVHVSSTAAPRESMVATALTYAGQSLDAAQLARVVRVFASVRAVRSTGCAALDLCDVARGRFDAFFEPGLKPWDTAAGALIVREAGGVVTSFDGAEHRPDAPDVLASNGRVHESLRALTAEPS